MGLFSTKRSNTLPSMVASSKESVSKAWSVTKGERKDNLNRAGYRMKTTVLLVTCIAMGVAFGWDAAAADTVKIGFNYPQTGPYAAEGLDQWRGAQMAVDEINTSGGIQGRQIELLIRDSKSEPQTAEQNALDLIDKGVSMMFGGASSGVAVAVGNVAHDKNV